MLAQFKTKVQNSNLKSNITISGTVVPHKKRGRALGYPTANIPLKNSLDEEGVYTGFTHYNNQKFPSLVFIGAAKTFGETEKKLEVHILDFSDNLYGKTISVELLKKIRDNKTFASKEDLIRAMKEDETFARAYFKEFGSIKEEEL